MCKPSSQANSFLKPMKDPFGPHTRNSISFPQRAGHGTGGPNPCLTWDCYLVHAHFLDAGGMEAVTTAATWIKAIVLASLGCSSAWQTSSGVTSLQLDQLNICRYRLRTGSSFRSKHRGSGSAEAHSIKALALTALTEQTHDTHRLHGLHGLQPCT